MSDVDTVPIQAGGLKPPAVDRIAWFIAAGAVALACSGCHAPLQRAVRAEASAADTLFGTPFDPQVPQIYRLYSGDTIKIRYPLEPDLDQEQPIRSDGMISLPYIGDVEAAYRSPGELAKELIRRYERVFEEPELTVIVVRESGRSIFVGGQVRSPGPLSLRPGQTLVQALLEAGGITTLGRPDEVLVLRSRHGEATYVLRANFQRILEGRERDVPLEPCDVIYVPETVIAEIGDFVEMYINRLLPRAVSFPFQTELLKQPVKIISNPQTTIPPVTITP